MGAGDGAEGSRCILRVTEEWECLRKGVVRKGTFA